MNLKNKVKIKIANKQEQNVIKRNKNILIIIVFSILIVTAFVFSGSINNGFVNYDDDVYITNNKQIKDLSLNGIKNIFASYSQDNLPVTLLSFAIDYKLWGLNPKMYHVENLLIHLLNIILVFYLILLISKRAELAVIVAILFAIHPLRVESVAWVAERKDMLFSFFYLSALIAYINYLKSRFKIKYLIFALIFSVISLLSKFSAVSFPVLLFVVDYFYDRKFSWKTILEKIPFFVMPLVSGIIHYFFAKDLVQNIVLVSETYTFFDRIILACYSVMFYIYKLFVPFELSALYIYPQKIDNIFPLSYYLGSGLFLVFCTTLILILIKVNKSIKKELIFGLMLFLIPVSIVLHIFPIGGNVVAADRYTYIPYIGLFYIIGLFYCLIKDGKIEYLRKFKTIFFVVFILFIISCSITTYNRNKIWKDSISLYNDVLTKNPNVDIAYYNRGLAKYDIKDYTGAMEDFNKSIILNPYKSDEYNSRAVIKYQMKDYNAAIEDCNKAIKLDSMNEDSYFNRGLAEMQINKLNDALNDFSKSIKINPLSDKPYYNRGLIRFYLKDFNGAISDYSKLIELYPENAEIYFNRSLASANLSDFKGALSDLDRAIFLNPDYIDAYKNRGNTKIYLKDIKGALEDFNKVIQLNSGDIDAYYNLGLLNYNSGSKAEACKYWQIASGIGDTKSKDMIKRYCNMINF